MLTLLMLSLAAHGIANVLCPVWRSAPDDAKGFAMIGFLAHAVAVVVLAKRRLAVMSEKFRSNHGIHWLDKDRAAWCLIAAMLLTGCKAETVEWVGPHGMMRMGTVVFGTDQTHRRVIPTPDGPINLDSADRGSPESLQRVSNDVTTTVAVMTAFITVTSAIKSLFTSIEAVNATSKAASVEKAAIGAGKAATK